MEGEGRFPKKRRNKNRPEEISSKKPPRQNFNQVRKPIDPRFDSAFGDFDEKAFTSTFGFLNKIKKREKYQLKKQLREEKNPEEIEKIEFLLTRIKNQEREKKKSESKQKKIDEERKKYAEAVFAGKKPQFPPIKQQFAEEVLQDFDELTSKGMLNKYISKKLKKQKFKNKKELNEFK